MDKRTSHGVGTPTVERVDVPDLDSVRRERWSGNLLWVAVAAGVMAGVAAAIDVVVHEADHSVPLSALLLLRLGTLPAVALLAWLSRRSPRLDPRPVVWAGLLVFAAANGVASGLIGRTSGLTAYGATGCLVVALCGMFPARVRGGLLLSGATGALFVASYLASAGVGAEALQFLAPLAFVLLAAPPVATMTSWHLEVALQADVQACRVLDEARAQAQLAAQSHAEFLTTLSREVRAPIDGVLGMTALLKGTDLDEEQAEYVQGALHCGDTLITLLDDIRDLSKMNAGQLDLETVEFSLDELIDGVLEPLTEMTQSEAVTLSSHLDPDVPTAVLGDPGRIRQILMNLVGNALKFTLEGSVQVHARVLRESLGDAVLKIEVIDTGFGVPPDEQDRIFEPFTAPRRTDSDQRDRRRCSGLGLPVVRRIVRLMGGDVGVESSGVGGSTFWFTTRIKKLARPQQRKFQEDHRLRNVRVLVVDDAATNLVIIKKHMQRWNMRPEICGDPTEVLSRVRQAQAAGDPIRVLLLGTGLPKLDATEVVKRLRAEPGLRLPRVMLMSGARIEERVRAARREDVLACLGKPVRPAYLRTWLLRCVAMGRSAPLEQTPASAPSNAPPVLIVEDNPVNQRLTAHMVEKFGYEPHIARDGIEALAAIRAREFAAVLMDIEMPRMGGHRATRVIRTLDGLRGGVPIIAMTAHALPEDRDRSLALGMQEYISKPIDRDALEQTLRRLVYGAAECGAA